MSEQPSERPPGSLVLSPSELRYLLAAFPSERADSLGLLLGIEEIGDIDDAFLPGASALLARGLLGGFDTGDLGPTGEALPVGLVLGSPSAWWALTAAIDGRPEFALVIDSPAGALLAQPGPVGVFAFTPLVEGADPRGFVVELAEGMISAEASAVLRVTGDGAEGPVVFSARRDGTAVQYGWGLPGEDEPRELVPDGDPETMAAAFRRLLGAAPGR